MQAERDLELDVMKQINAKYVWPGPARPGPARLCRRALSDETVCVDVSGLARVSRFWRHGYDGICALGSQISGLTSKAVFCPGLTERRCAVSSSIARLQTLTGDRQPTVLAAAEDKTFLVARGWSTRYVRACWPAGR